MEIARTLFGPRAPQGYTDGSTQGQVHTAADDDDDADDVFLPDTPEGLSTGKDLLMMLLLFISKLSLIRSTKSVCYLWKQVHTN